MAGEESDRVEGAEYLLLSGHLQIFVGFIVLSIILLCDGTGHLMQLMFYWKGFKQYFIGCWKH